MQPGLVTCCERSWSLLRQADIRQESYVALDRFMGIARYFQMTRSDHQGNPNIRESRTLAPVRPSMQAAGLQCLKLQLAVAYPDTQTCAFPGTEFSRKIRSPNSGSVRKGTACSLGFGLPVSVRTKHVSRKTREMLTCFSPYKCSLYLYLSIYLSLSISIYLSIYLFILTCLLAVVRGSGFGYYYYYY